MRLQALFVLALLVAACVATSGQKPQPQPTFLGVLDGHGRLTPVAVYDGRIWWNRWPWAGASNPDGNLPLPRSLAAIPPEWLPPGLRLPVNWTAFTSGKLFPIRAVRPTRQPEQALMATVPIATTYRGHPQEEDTLAISGPGTLAEFVALGQPESDAILRQLESRIATLETGEIARWKKDITEYKDTALTRTYMIRGPSGTRYVGTPPPGQEREYRILKGPTPIGGRTYQFLHGEKLFKLRPEEDCMMNLSTQGFIVVDQRGGVESEKLSVFAFAEYCGDARETTYHLATITIGPRTWWVVKMALEDGYDYGLLDPLSGEEVVLKGL